MTTIMPDIVCVMYHYYPLEREYKTGNFIGTSGYYIEKTGKIKYFEFEDEKPAFDYDKMNITIMAMMLDNFLMVILVVLTVLNLIVPLTANAEKITEKYYKYDDYTIKYEVVNSWENNQNVSITISNTSNNSIAGWTLKYDAGGEIRDLWNGIVYSNNETDYIIKNSGYNFEIIPDNSVILGYTLSGENLIIPDKI